MGHAGQWGVGQCGGGEIQDEGLQGGGPHGRALGGGYDGRGHGCPVDGGHECVQGDVRGCPQGGDHEHPLCGGQNGAEVHDWDVADEECDGTHDAS